MNYQESFRKEHESGAISGLREAPAGGQAESPAVLVEGRLLESIPDDLYVPPDALRIFLETFEGPLDLLLYLIKRRNLDILTLPVAEITEQYMRYIEMAQELRLELAAEYLVMAAMLAEIKSCMLLPRRIDQEEEEDDPRRELIRRLLEYQRFKKAAGDLDILPRLDRDYSMATVEVSVEIEKPLPEVGLDELLAAFREVLVRVDLRQSYHVQREALSVRERMIALMSRVSGGGLIAFTDCFLQEEGRSGAVVTLLAVLEMLRSRVIDIVQAASYSPVYIRESNPESGLHIR